MNVAVILSAIKNNIKMLKLQAQTSNHLPPLDLSVFKAMK